MLRFQIEVILFHMDTGTCTARRYVAIPCRLTFCRPVFTARRYASAVYAVIVCPSVRRSVSFSS